MADADDVRRLALALPHVEEIDSDGFDFRVAGKGFIWSYPERRPGERRRIRTDIAVLYVGDEAEKQALLLGEPGLFFTAPGYDGWPLVLLRLAEVDVGRLAELVTDAWRMRAPQPLADELDRLTTRRGAWPQSLPPGPPGLPVSCGTGPKTLNPFSHNGSGAPYRTPASPPRLADPAAGHHADPHEVQAPRPRGPGLRAHVDVGSPQRGRAGIARAHRG
jgi:hypothetical protein